MSNDRINRRLDKLEQEQGGKDCGPAFVINYSRNWHGGYARSPEDGPDWDTYNAATTPPDPRPLDERIAAAIERIRQEAIEHDADPSWICYVRTTERGTVQLAGAPWWPETPTGGPGGSFIARDDVWRSY